MQKYFQDRIKYNGDLKELSSQISLSFGLGTYIKHKIVPIGYEDFNYVLTTSKGKFFVKIFSTQRTLSDAKRIVGVMSKAVTSHIAIPKLYKSNQGYLHLIRTKGATLKICVMKFIDGKDFFSSGKSLTSQDIEFIAHQTALINKLNIKPRKNYDSWAITNFLSEYKKKSRFLNKDDLLLIKPLVTKFKKIKISTLPHCFAHGDIIKTNVIKDKANKIWIVDFSVANRYPRIQELAVLSCDVLFDNKSKKGTDSMLNLALNTYQKKISLTEREKKSLPIYIKLAHAMHVLCATYEKKHNKNKSLENEYFLNLGRVGLRRQNSVVTT